MHLDPDQVDYFQGQPVLAGTKVAGWAALVHSLGIKAPVRQPSCISEKYVGGSQRIDGAWRVFDKRYEVGTTVADHLTFALRHEAIDLLILKRIFEAVPASVIETIIKDTPTGTVARRIWFFYELLTGSKLDLEDAQNVAAVDALDPDRYFTSRPKLSQRHRVRDNLLGTADFCPIIRKSDKLIDFLELELAQKARDTVVKTGAQIVARAASFMLLADSRASFEIEGERPPQSRVERWGRAVLEAGKRPLNQTEIYRLHTILIGDDRFTEIGYRSDGVFLGERDFNNDPIPEFIGARHADLPTLMTGLIECNNRMRSTDIDGVLQAAAIAFGFVYIHPLADGNGRLHRCLIHHVLAERGVTPSGMLFPVSSVMLDRIEDYRDTLQAHSAPLMPFIEWNVTADQNVEVINETADLYRYFDCTAEAEFLYACVQRTVEHDLPQEIDYLKRHDAALKRIMNAVEMPDRVAQSLIIFIRQNGFKLARRRRENEFEKLTDAEVAAIEAIIRDEFEEIL
ncbi:MAG: Fic family protein [Pelagibacterium sp.]|uniref:Fic family protein n=1 Tax=Pelagibacterium sp. TaxID=1967288 RepID=UPI0032EB9FAA